MKIDSLSLDGQPTSLKGRFLTDAELLIFTSSKPIVIYGFAAIPKNKTLNIEAGTNVYFHDNSGLIVDDKATLKVKGTRSKKVVFEGDRLEHSFSDIPGQWGTIWMRAGSINNEIHHAIIRNGIIGILVDSSENTARPTLKLENTEIYNHASFGILGRETNIEGHNLVIGNAGQASLAATIGGSYNFTHATFSNFWSNSLRQLPAVLINNFFVYKNEAGEEIIETRNLHTANFTNCIFDGNNNIEFIIDFVDGGGIFNYNISNSMIQFNDINNSFNDIPQLDFTNPFYQNNILNGNSHFRDPQRNDFVIGEESDAINKASSSAYPEDLLGVDRTSNPDIGAYQHVVFE